jgi:hypothetical protein
MSVFAKLSFPAALVFACAVPLLAQERFETPEAAAKAVIDAAERGDSQRLAAILGPRGEAILFSGDATRDRSEQSEFATQAHVKHRVELAPINPNRAILSIGEEDWPFPVPIICTNGKWMFDASETPVEMKARRIGANELDAIEICQGLVEAQRKYAARNMGKDGMPEYASHLLAGHEASDGLYHDGDGEPLVPASLAQAEWNGARQGGGAKAYHGYYFRILDRQGPHAPGGAHAYLFKGKLIGGFAVVAWPANYAATGIHTFIVNQDGVVYQKDIAPVAGKSLVPVTSFDPDHTWEPADIAAK